MPFLLIFSASNIPGAITTLLHSSFGQRVSVCTRMFWALSVLVAAFGSLLALSIPDSDLWQERFLHVTLMLIVLANVGVNVLQVSWPDNLKKSRPKKNS